jgi:hypothetical protein
MDRGYSSFLGGLVIGTVILAIVLMLTDNSPPIIAEDFGKYQRCTLTNGETFILSRGKFFGYDTTIVYDIHGNLYSVAQILRCETMNFEPGEEIK